MLESGVPNLDRILGGGIPEGDVVLVTGPAGSGKTTLVFQIAFHIASSARNVIYVSTLSKPPTRLIRHLQPFSFVDKSLIGKNLFFFHGYPIIKEGLDRTITALVSAVNDHQATLVVVDGLDTIRDLHAELTMSDSVILLGQNNAGTQAIRTFQLQKVRGCAPLLGVHSLRIDSDGVRIFPRIESVTPRHDHGLSMERLSFGLPELDGMMSGGLSRGSVSLLAGALGTGKTLIGLQYILAGARRGEKGLIIGFREPPRLLCDKMRSFGMDLETPLEQGLLVIRHHVPIDLRADEVVDGIRREIEELAPRRLLLDSLAEIEHAVEDERRRRSVLVCLAEIVRAHQVTALLTREMSQVAGPELDFSDSPLAILSENLFLLRYVEFRSELYRILSILKMRDTNHDRTIRQYRITSKGFEVLAALESAEGILTGIARLPSEMRVKRPARRATGEG
jgi:circadian clock protein KaiC